MAVSLDSLGDVVGVCVVGSSIVVAVVVHHHWQLAARGRVVELEKLVGHALEVGFSDGLTELVVDYFNEFEGLRFVGRGEFVPEFLEVFGELE